MLTRATEALIETLTYPTGFISPLEIEDAVTRALAEDLGRAGEDRKSTRLNSSHT